GDRIGVADTAGNDTHQDFPTSRFLEIQLLENKRAVLLLYDQRADFHFILQFVHDAAGDASAPAALALSRRPGLQRRTTSVWVLRGKRPGHSINARLRQRSQDRPGTHTKPTCRAWPRAAAGRVVLPQANRLPGDPYENRTRVSAVRGPRPNR